LGFKNQDKQLAIFRSLKWALFPVAYFVYVILFYPFRFVLEFDPDEGNILILANQITEGISLYSEAWNDHPPLIPHFLAVIFKIFGTNVTIARLFILLLSCTLIWAMVVYLRSFWGSMHALTGVLLVFLLPYYTQLSVSVMIGLPSIAFAIISFVFLAFWHQKRSTPLLIMSALTLGISVMIKLQTSYLAIVFCVGLLISEFRQRGDDESLIHWVKPAFTWTLGFLCVVLFVGVFYIGREGIPLLVGTHLTARSTNALLSWSGDIFQVVMASWPIFTLSLIGSFYAIRTRSFTAIYLIAWIFLGYLLLTQLKPIWYHHQLLLTIPACMLAAIAVGESFRALRHFLAIRAMTHSSSLPVVISLSTLAAYLYLRILPALSEFHVDFPNVVPPRTHATPREEMLAIISDYADETVVLVTDRPMFAFRTGIAVPPELAVISGKRFLSGMLTEDDFIRITRSTNPEQVALTRFPMPRLIACLADNYHLRYSLSNNQLFIRNDLLIEE
jgi:hypothetical protein